MKEAINNRNIIWSERSTYWQRDIDQWYENEYDTAGLSKIELSNKADDAYYSRDLGSVDFSLNLEHLKKIYTYTNDVTTSYELLAICELIKDGKKLFWPVSLGHHMSRVFAYNHDEETLAGLGYAYEPHWYTSYKNIYCELSLSFKGETACENIKIVYKGLNPYLSAEQRNTFFELLTKHNFENNLTSVEWSKYTVPLKDLISKDGNYLWGKPLYA